ncbi:MAG: 1-acyl-sn-glycerol-3-phosphate acyltransferase [Propionibacteriaceae bacterium]|nr:1-acyl-sn-glycerol-3-phosphate acyltransferase [Propionibacteriaceae bacterium]
MLYNLIKYLIARPICLIVFRAKVFHKERVPESGAVILAGNHLGTGETFLVPAVLHRPMTFAAKKELYTKPGLWGRFARWFLYAIHQVPIDRSGGGAADTAMHSVENVLEEGGVVGFFPEGKRSPDGKLHKGHTGVARLALDAGCPVVPFGVANTRFRKGWLPWPWLYGPTVTIGEPVTIDAATRDAYLGAANRDESGAVLRRVTDDIMRAIQAITGQEYVDEYARRRADPASP